MKSMMAGRPPPPDRDVARPITNLGNTCYMNAVLQALAHAPELCMAMDVEPHYVTCPIYLRQERLSPSSSPDSVAMPPPPPPPLRKSKRSSGKRSPTPGQQQERGRPAERNGESKRADQDNNFCALCELEQHLLRVHQGPSGNMRDVKPVAPASFVHGFISHVAPWFQLGVQEDSHEFLRILIDAMQNSCKNARAARKDPSISLPESLTAEKKEQGQEQERLQQQQQQQSQETIIPGERGSTTPSAHRTDAADATNGKDSNADSEPEPDNEYPFRLFRGLVESSVTCESCNATSVKIDPIEDIGLEVLASPSSPSPTLSNGLADVGSAFRRFARPEALDSGYKCEKCGKCGRGTKQSRLASIPPILTLHLKRFRYGEAAKIAASGPATRRSNRTSELSQLLGANGGDFYAGKSGSAKIEGHAKFEQVVDLHPLLTKDLQKTHQTMFCRLFAVIVHAGKNSHSGHYYSYVRHFSKNEWWKMDDSRVTQASAQEVMNAEAYMLLYRVTNHNISNDLRSRNKKMQDHVSEGPNQDAAAAAAAVSSSTVPPFAENSSATNAPSKVQQKENPAVEAQSTSRKRKAPGYPNGEEWARAKTNLPESFIKKFASMEQVVSEFINFKPSYFKHISAMASKNGAKVGSGPSTIAMEEDVADGQEVIRVALIELLYKFSLECQQDLLKSPELSPSPTMPKSMPASVRRENAVTKMVEPASEHSFL